MCERGFALRSDLTRHVKTQHRLGNETYACHVHACTFTTIRKDSISPHLKRRHKSGSETQVHNALDKREPKNIEESLHNVNFTGLCSTNSNAIELLSNCITFIHAARAGNIPILQALLDAGADVHMTAGDKSNALHCAAREGHTSTVKYLLERGVHIRITNAKGRSALHEAILGRNPETVNLLLRNGADLSGPEVTVSCLARSASMEIFQACIDHLGPDFALSIRYDVLVAASKIGNITFVAALLSHHVSDGIPQVTQATGGALGKGHTKGSRKVTSHRPLLSSTSNQKRYGPIHVAASKGHLELVRLLLQHQTKFSSSAINHHCQPLHLASREGHYKIVKLLLSEPNIDVNWKDSWGHTPLQYSIRGGHYETVKLLLGQDKIKVNEFSKDSPLELAAEKGHVEVVKLLLNDCRVDCRFQRTGRDTALQIAAFGSHWKVVQALLDHEKDPATRGTNQDVFEGRYATSLDIVQELFRHPDFQDINCCRSSWYRHDNFGGGLLHASAQKGDCDVLGLLLDCDDIDVNLGSTVYGKTPLQFAAEFGQFGAVQMLIQHKDININFHRNLQGRTALQCAREKGFSNIVQLLLEYGATDENKSATTPGGGVSDTTATVTEINIQRDHDATDSALEIPRQSFFEEHMDSISGELEEIYDGEDDDWTTKVTM
jgi:ankyrin repeat protein